MNIDNNNQLLALQEATIKKKAETRERAKMALTEMVNKNLPINFASVAKYACVSKTWLYSQCDLAQEIKNHRFGADELHRNIDLIKKVSIQAAKIDKLKDTVSKKDHEIKRLKKQMEIVYGELYKKDSSL